MHKKKFPLNFETQKTYRNTTMGDAETVSVKVYVRLRPLVARELEDCGGEIRWKYNNNAIVEDTGSGTKTRTFDGVMAPDSTNKDAYELIAKDMVEKSMTGHNATIFAYGQTGSGKTWTMMGDDQGKHPGIIPLALQRIFKMMEERKSESIYSLKVSFMEIYNEQINDLLSEDPATGQNLPIKKDDPDKGAIIGNLTEVSVTSTAEALEAMERGNSARQTASTQMNARSSRSHTVFRIVIESVASRERVERENKIIKEFNNMQENGGEEEFHSFGSSGYEPEKSYCFLTLVDLAGSERQKNTKATGKTLKEGTAINKSLLALGDVISKLGLGDQSHVPYRNSKLTRILKHSLGGNSYTAVAIAMTPAPMHTAESVSSLKFGQLCKKIQNKSKGGKRSKADALRMYKLECMRLKEEMSAVKMRDEELLREVKLLHEHDEELEHTVEQLTHDLQENKQLLDNVAFQAVDSERKLLKKRLESMQDIFMGGSAGDDAIDNQWEYVLDVLMKETEGNAEVEKLVKNAVDQVSHVYEKRKQERADRKSRKRNGWQNIRRLSMPLVIALAKVGDIEPAKGMEQPQANPVANWFADKEKEMESSGDLDEFYHHSKSIQERYEGKIDDVEQKNEELKKTIEDLRHDALEQSGEIGDIRKENKRLQSKLHDYDELTEKLKESQTEVANIVKEIKQKEAKHEQQVLGHEQRQEGLHDDLKLSKEKYIQLAEELESMRDSNEKLKAEKQAIKLVHEQQKIAVLAMQSKMLFASAGRKSRKARRMSVATLDLQWPAIEQAVENFVSERKRLDDDLEHLNAIKTEVDKTKAKIQRWNRDLEDKELTLQKHRDLLEKEKLEASTRKEDLERREVALKKHENLSLERDIDLSHRESDIEKKEAHLNLLENSLQEQHAELQQDQEKNSAKEAGLRAKEHDLHVKSMKVDSATAIQRVIRQALLRKASLNSKKLVVELETVKKTIEENKRSQKEHRMNAEELHSRTLDLDYKEEDLARKMHDIDEKETRIQRIHDDIVKREKRQTEVEDELDKLTMEVAAEQQRLHDWRQDLAKSDTQRRSEEKELQALKIEVFEKLESQQKQLLDIERSKTRMAVESSYLKQQRVEMENLRRVSKEAEMRHIDRELNIQKIKEETSEERNRVRSFKADLAGREGAVRSKEIKIEEEMARISEMQQEIKDKEHRAHEIEMRLTMIERREFELKEFENEFYTRKAADITRKNMVEISALERQLEHEVNTVTKFKQRNDELRIEMESLRDQLDEHKNDKTREDAVESLSKVKELLESMKAQHESPPKEFSLHKSNTPHYAMSTESRRHHIREDKDAHRRTVAVTL